MKSDYDYEDENEDDRRGDGGMAIMPGRSNHRGGVREIVSHCAHWERLSRNAENRRSSSATTKKIGRTAVNRQTAMFRPSQVGGFGVGWRPERRFVALELSGFAESVGVTGGSITVQRPAPCGARHEWREDRNRERLRGRGRLAIREESLAEPDSFPFPALTGPPPRSRIRIDPVSPANAMSPRNRVLVVRSIGRCGRFCAPSSSGHCASR